MGKTIRSNNPESKKKYTKHKKQTSEETSGKTYEKKHEKGHYPRRVWPTDSEKHKGPKI